MFSLKVSPKLDGCWSAVQGRALKLGLEAIFWLTGTDYLNKLLVFGSAHKKISSSYCWKTTLDHDATISIHDVWSLAKNNGLHFYTKCLEKPQKPDIWRADHMVDVCSASSVSASELCLNFTIIADHLDTLMTTALPACLSFPDCYIGFYSTPKKSSFLKKIFIITFCNFPFYQLRLPMQFLGPYDRRTNLIYCCENDLRLNTK